MKDSPLKNGSVVVASEPDACRGSNLNNKTWHRGWRGGCGCGSVHSY